VKGSNLLRRVVLVVDDEPLIVLNLKTVLEIARAKVICTNTRDAGKVVGRPDVSASVLDARPESSDHTARRPPVEAAQPALPLLFAAAALSTRQVTRGGADRDGRRGDAGPALGCGQRTYPWCVS
jgi:DNA-binding NtrC family response regulator